jgi:hypothetical protein
MEAASKGSDWKESPTGRSRPVGFLSQSCECASLLFCTYESSRVNAWLLFGVLSPKSTADAGFVTVFMLLLLLMGSMGLLWSSEKSLSLESDGFSGELASPVPLSESDQKESESLLEPTMTFA